MRSNGLSVVRGPWPVVGDLVNEPADERKNRGAALESRDCKWVEERLAAAAELRGSMPGVWITDEEIRVSRDEGRA